MTTPLNEKPVGVSSIELFFDLVFVFVITQVTQLVEHAHGAMDFLRALLVLVPIWWMYAGYAWLTNNVRVTWQMRLVLIAAMAGFLVMAMAIPEVFGKGAMALFMLGDVFFRWVMGMRPIAVRSFGAAVALVLGFFGTRWGAQAALAAIALLAVA